MIDRLRVLAPGDFVSTPVLPGWSADVEIRAAIEVDGCELFVVLLRPAQAPGDKPEFALRDRDQISEPLDAH